MLQVPFSLPSALFSPLQRFLVPLVLDMVVCLVFVCLACYWHDAVIGQLAGLYLGGFGTLLVNSSMQVIIFLVVCLVFTDPFDNPPNHTNNNNALAERYVLCCVVLFVFFLGGGDGDRATRRSGDAFNRLVMGLRRHLNGSDGASDIAGAGAVGAAGLGPPSPPDAASGGVQSCCFLRRRVAVASRLRHAALCSCNNRH